MPPLRFLKARHGTGKARGTRANNHDIVVFFERKRLLLLGDLPFALCVLLFAHAVHDT